MFLWLGRYRFRWDHFVFVLLTSLFAANRSKPEAASITASASHLASLSSPLLEEEAKTFATPFSTYKNNSTLIRRSLEGNNVESLESVDAYLNRIKSENKPLFAYIPEISVLGPTHVLPPTHMIPGGITLEKPAIGSHRPDQDAVVAFAAEYEIGSFVTFCESLRATGFRGDIVLAVSNLDMKSAEVLKYVTTIQNIVVYSPRRVCYNFEGEAVESAKGGMRPCECPGLFGSTNITYSLKDPRPARTLATLRYELYWIMIRNYSPHSWILVADARDTFFQSNPFYSVPRNTDPTGRTGLLYFFGENVDATRIGKSPKNSKWITTAYGNLVGYWVKDKPTICSGATMGEQIAMIAYVSAIVSESDETGILLTGADQGFHNYLHYSHKLANVLQIHDIIVFDQGTGIVNNLGAMRTRPLNQWGHGGILRDIIDSAGAIIGHTVLNWDGTISPVVHQYDRHKQLQKYFSNKLGKNFLKSWRKKNSQ